MTKRSNTERCPTCGQLLPDKQLLPGMDELSQGAKAGRSGNYGWERLQAAFAPFKGRLKVQVVKYHPEWMGPSAAHWTDPQRRKILIRECQIRKKRIDGVYRDFDRNLTLSIEVRNQAKKGTTDEKLGNLVDRLVKVGWPYWVVLSGDGFSRQAIEDVSQKVKALNAGSNPRGRLIFDPMLQRAVERLVERGET